MSKSTLEMTREEWLDARRTGIGGSDVAAILGLSPWKSPVMVYMDKIGESPDQEENEAMYWGNVLEDVVAKEFEKRTGMKVKRKNAIIRHADYPWMLANVDRLIIGQKAGLECKTANEYAKDAWDGDKAPDVYILQCMHYMAVTGFKEWWIAVLIGGNKFHFKKIERDEELITFLIEKESEFWKLVENRTPPELDGSEASANLLKVMYPVSEPESAIDLPPDGAEWLDRYIRAKEAIEAAEAEKELAENQLKAMMQETETAWSGTRKITWKTQYRKSIDSKRLQAEKPDIYTAYLKESPSRPFKIGEVKTK